MICLSLHHFNFINSPVCWCSPATGHRQSYPTSAPASACTLPSYATFSLSWMPLFFYLHWKSDCSELLSQSGHSQSEYFLFWWRSWRPFESIANQHRSQCYSESNAAHLHHLRLQSTWPGQNQREKPGRTGFEHSKMAHALIWQHWCWYLWWRWGSLSVKRVERHTGRHFSWPPISCPNDYLFFFSMEMLKFFFVLLTPTLLMHQKALAKALLEDLVDFSEDRPRSGD